MNNTKQDTYKKQKITNIRKQIKKCVFFGFLI